MTRTFGGLVLALAACTAACSGTASPDTSSTPTNTPTTVLTPASGPPSTVQVETTTTTGDPSVTTAPTPSTTIAIPPAADLVVRLEEVGSVQQAVFLTTLPDDPRLFVVGQAGRIWVLAEEENELVLDIRGRVGTGGERGLLGMAFHPDFASNRLLYVNYTNNSGDTIVAEYVMDDDATADPTSERVVLRVNQPANNHNGGMIAFGDDGYLWIGMGDGGGSNDQFRTARRPDRLLGAMLRIDVGPAAPEPYGIPADNPYADGEEGRPEVWAIGLRNPWRFWFDEARLYVGDVGQGRVEEVSVVPMSPSGPDFGWSVVEGDECFRSKDCDRSGFVTPSYTYGHGAGCSITGGVVYRGSALPEIDGHYFFGDYCSGWVRSIVVDESGDVVEELEWPDLGIRLPTSFAVDAAGEMYILSGRGPIYKVVRDG